MFLTFCANTCATRTVDNDIVKIVIFSKIFFSIHMLIHCIGVLAAQAQVARRAGFALASGTEAESPGELCGVLPRRGRGWSRAQASVWPPTRLSQRH